MKAFMLWVKHLFVESNQKNNNCSSDQSTISCEMREALCSPPRRIPPTRPPYRTGHCRRRRACSLEGSQRPFLLNSNGVPRPHSLAGLGDQAHGRAALLPSRPPRATSSPSVCSLAAESFRVAVTESLNPCASEMHETVGSWLARPISYHTLERKNVIHNKFAFIS
jgi:hypothetical protein